MPNPRKGEEQKDFIGRCMEHPHSKEKFPDNKQRVAVCYGLWRKKHGGEKPESKGIGKYAK